MTTTAFPGSLSEQPALLQARGITRRFGATTAVAGVDFEVHAGEVHALLGENGAGKSTLVSILSGELGCDEGQVMLDGHPVSAGGLHEAHRVGIRVIHQHPGVFAGRSVAENVMVGDLPTQGGWVRRKEMLLQARSALRTLGIDWAPAGPIPGDIASHQLLEAARALRSRARVLIFDEPTAALSATEVTRLHEIIRRLKSTGVAIIYITHRLEELVGLADRVTVLREGRVVLGAPTAQLDQRAILEAMVGSFIEPVKSSARDKTLGDAPGLLTCRGLQGGAFRDVDLEVRAGEVVGLAGLVGSGRDELVETVGGVIPSTGGAASVLGVDVQLRSVRAARRAGIIFVPGDRARTVIAESTVAVNIAVGDRAATGRWVVGRRRMADVAKGWIARYSVTPRRPGALARQLSGGNQQKVMLARAINAQPRLLVLAEPTLGVDLGAKRLLHEAILEHSRSGAGVLISSGDFSELAALCDRVLIMCRGTVSDHLTGEAISVDAILHAALST